MVVAQSWRRVDRHQPGRRPFQSNHKRQYGVRLNGAKRRRSSGGRREGHDERRGLQSAGYPADCRRDTKRRGGCPERLLGRPGAAGNPLEKGRQPLFSRSNKQLP